MLGIAASPVALRGEILSPWPPHPIPSDEVMSPLLIEGERQSRSERKKLAEREIDFSPWLLHHRRLEHRCCAFAFVPAPRPLISSERGRRWLLRVGRDSGGHGGGCGAWVERTRRWQLRAGREEATVADAGGGEVVAEAADAPAWVGRCPYPSARAAGRRLVGGWHERIRMGNFFHSCAIARSYFTLLSLICGSRPAIGARARLAFGASSPPRRCQKLSPRYSRNAGES